jgi:hypothetical protein
MPICPVNLLWLTDPHDLHGMRTPNGNLELSIEKHMLLSVRESASDV